MYWQLLVVALAFCWLAHRIYALATVPLDQLVKTLAVDIPRAATISVDNITDTTVYIHWDKPPKDVEHRIASFLVYLNGKNVATLSGRDVHTHISGLIPNTKYQIDLVTVNHKTYKAKSRPVFIKTKSTELQRKSHSNASENPLENPETLFKMLTENSDLSVEKLPSISLTTPAGDNGDVSIAGTPNGRRGGRSRSNTVSSTINNDLASTAVQSINMLPDPKSIQDIEELRYYLESRQEELHTVLNQQSQILQEFKEQELLLSDQRMQLRERKKLEDNDRSLVKSQINNLDESRRNAELKRSKQETSMLYKKKLIEKMTNELDEWNRKMDEFEQEKIHIETSEDKVHEEMDSDVEKKKTLVNDLQASISTIEDEIKQLLAQKKQREQNRPQLLKIFKTIGRHTDSTGLIDQEGVQNLDLLKSINPLLWEKVNKEILTDSQLEAQWRAEQQRAVSNCEKANAVKDYLLAELEKIKNGRTSSADLSPASPPLSTLHLSGSSQVLPSLSGNGVAYPQIPSHSSNSSNNSFTNGYFSGSVSPPTDSAMLHSQSQSSNHQSSLWNSNGLSLSYKPTSKLSLTTNLKTTELLTQEDLDSPSIDHFLPTDLITEQFNDMTFPMSPDKSNSIESEGFASGQSSTPKNANVSLLAGSAPTSFTQNMHFPGEFNNLSSRSIFHNDFGMAPNSLRPSLDNPSSPPLSFQNEFLSAHNSPATNNNDIASMFSGGNVDVLPTFSQTSGETKTQAAYKSAFSPRRLSSVFGFGNKNKNSTSNSIDAATSSSPESAPVNPSSAGTKQSKFFHRSQNSDLNPQPPAPAPPIFKFDQNTQTPGAVSNSAFNILDLWSSPFGGDHGDAKQHANGQKLEEASKVWSNPAPESNTSGDSKVLGVPSSSNSLSSQAISDANATDLGPVVQLTNTNKSTKSIKSKTSVDGSSSGATTSSSPSGLFRRKSNLLNFGHKKNTQAGEKSPVKQHTQLTRMESPTRIDSHDDGEVEDFAPAASSSKKLFSRRMSFNTNVRKQSNSSHETDGVHGQDQNSVQSNSTTNSRSIVRKLSLFGNKMNGAKDTNVIDEHDDEDDR